MSDKAERRLFLVIVIIAALSMAYFYYQIRNTQTDIRNEATARVTEIQYQRFITTYNNCKDQNRRHDNTINALDHVAKAIIKANPGERAAINKGIAQNVLLINALAPKRDCKKLASLAVKSGVRKNTTTTTTTN